MYCAVGHGRQPWLYLSTIASRPAGCAAAKADFAQARSDRRRRRGWSEGTGAGHQGWGGKSRRCSEHEMNRIFRFLKSDSTIVIYSPKLKLALRGPLTLETT